MPDESILDHLGRRQYGLVTFEQLGGAGFTPRMVHRLSVNGRLVRVRRGIYRLSGTPLSWRGTAMAAVLAGGPGAVLSHRSAGALWRLIDHRELVGGIEITSPGVRQLEGVTFHRHQLDVNETFRHEWILVTTVERTLVDLAETDPRIGQRIDLALRLKLTTMRRLERAAARRAGPGRRRSHGLAEALSRRGAGYDPGANDWELSMDRWWDAAGLPRSQRQFTVRLPGRSYRLDRAIVAQKIAIEWNGRSVHGTRSGFERDTERRARLTAAGWSVLEFTPGSSPEFIRATVLSVHQERQAVHHERYAVRQERSSNEEARVRPS